jgi:hypothetical protein
VGLAETQFMCPQSPRQLCSTGVSAVSEAVMQYRCLKSSMVWRVNTVYPQECQEHQSQCIVISLTPLNDILFYVKHC